MYIKTKSTSKKFYTKTFDFLYTSKKFWSKLMYEIINNVKVKLLQVFKNGEILFDGKCLLVHIKTIFDFFFLILLYFYDIVAHFVIVVIKAIDIRPTDTKPMHVYALISNHCNKL